MDAQRLARDIGRLLAQRAVGYGITIEANIMTGPIFPSIVDLEPSFVVFDPAQTFQPVTERRQSPARRYPWVTQRIFLPVLAQVDGRRVEAFAASLARCQAFGLEFLASQKDASFYLSAPADEIAFVTASWLAAFPNSALVECGEPWEGINPEELVLYDLCSPAGYQARVRAVTPWNQVLHLCTKLRGDQVVFLQVVASAARQSWQENIARLGAADRSLGQRAPQHTIALKNLDEPLFATVIRIGTTAPHLASSISALAGMCSAEGKPFTYRTIDDFLRVIARADVVGMLRVSTPAENSPKFRSKIPQPREVVVYSFGWRMVHRIQPVKRRRALLESNSPRNSRLQTHQDDEARGEAGSGLALGLKKNPHRIDRFAHA